MSAPALNQGPRVRRLLIAGSPWSDAVLTAGDRLQSSTIGSVRNNPPTQPCPPRQRGDVAIAMVSAGPWHHALMNESSQRGRWVAILTGAISIAIAVAYLALITVLDARGPLQPPPPEALGLQAPALSPLVVAAADPAASAAAGVPPRG
ncbi:MAG: hypothetical protein RLZZ611_525 [Cyanobacteriota bacterium]|jgi:hypothetical protein